MKKLLLISLLFCSVAKAQLIPPLYSIFNKAFSYDADALAFFTAASITDNTQKNAINTLVVSLKANSLWTKCIAIYPFVGGNATAHSKDLKASFNLTFFGSPTHDANGVTFNGTSQYANTGIVPSTSLSLNDVHLSFYSRTSGVNGNYDIGTVTSGGDNSYLTFIPRASGDLNVSSANNGEATHGTITDASGFFIVNRASSTTYTLYRNGSSADAVTSTSSVLSTRAIYISALDYNGGVGFYGSRNSCLVTVGTSFTSGEASTFSTIVNTFETSLSRNTY